jgi:hypothetical protein
MQLEEHLWNASAFQGIHLSNLVIDVSHKSGATGELGYLAKCGKM